MVNTVQHASLYTNLLQIQIPKYEKYEKYENTSRKNKILLHTLVILYYSRFSNILNEY